MQNHTKTRVRATMSVAIQSNRVRIQRMNPELTRETITGIKPMVPRAMRLFELLQRRSKGSINPEPGLTPDWRDLWDAIGMEAAAGEQEAEDPVDVSDSERSEDESEDEIEAISDDDL